jgi:hypothetical protein
MRGRLEEVAPAEVLRFIHQSRRSGTLLLRSGDSRVEIRFFEGEISSVRGPRSKPVGEILVEQGSIDRATLELALRVQERVRPRRPLAEILQATGVIEQEDLRSLVRAQVEETVFQLVGFTSGSFEFAARDFEPMELTHPGDLVVDSGLNTEALILGLSRLSEESDADVEASRKALAAAAKAMRPEETPATTQPPGPAPPPAAPPEPPPNDAAASLERLRRMVADLRGGLHSGTVALHLMHILSEAVERAVLFLVRHPDLVAVGAFGSGVGGRPLAETTRGLALDLARDHALSRALDYRVARSISCEAADLPEPFVRLVGRPRSGELVVLPVLGSQEVIAVVYADNGSLMRKIRGIDLLELAAAHLGAAFENELLRREMSSSSTAKPSERGRNDPKVAPFPDEAERQARRRAKRSGTGGGFPKP